MDDSEATVNDAAFSFGEDSTQPGRQVLSRGELLAHLTALMKSCEGCENVSVVGVTPLDRRDNAGCNWSLSLVLSTAGVAAEVYGLAYSQVIGMARSSWNLA
jgi:hypothetical protein